MNRQVSRSLYRGELVFLWACAVNFLNGADNRHMQRRQFLGSAAAAALATQTIRGANDRIAVGLIGCGGRGGYVAGLMRQAPGVEDAAGADVYLPNAERAKEGAGPQAQGNRDFPRAVDRKTQDAGHMPT